MLDYIQAPTMDYIRGVIDHLGLKKFEGGYPSLTLKSSLWNEPFESELYVGPLPSSNDGQRPRCHKLPRSFKRLNEFSRA